MKKTLKILVFTLIISFCFLTSLRAEIKTLECNYRRNYMGDSSSKYSFDFEMNYNYDTKKKKVEFSIPTTEYTVGGTKFKLNSSNMNLKNGFGVSYLNKKYDEISSGKCPIIYTQDVKNKNTNEVFLRVSDEDLSSYNTGFFKVTVLDGNGNDANTGASRDDKICNLRINSTAVGTDVTTKNQYRIFEFQFVTKPNGSVFLTFGQDSTYGNATQEITGTGSDTKAQVWTLKNSTTFTGNTYIRITNEEAQNIKNALAYNSKVCPQLYVNPTDNKNIYELSTKKKENGTTASDKFSVDDDETFTELVKSGVINLPISNEIGTCVTYLGSADTEGTIASYLQVAFTIIKVGSIVILIVTAMLDMSSAITNSKDNLTDTINKYVKRLIILIIILLLPTFLDVFGNVIGIDDILCGIK